MQFLFWKQIIFSNKIDKILKFYTIHFTIFFIVLFIYVNYMIQLYGSKHSCSITIHYLLELLWADYEKFDVQIGSEELKKINPRGAVPAIIDTDNNVTLTQLTAISQYLAKKYPSKNLGSDGDIVNDYKLNHLLALLNSDIHTSFWPFFVTGKFTTSTDAEIINDIKSASIKKIYANMQYLDNLLGTKQYFLFDRLTIADIYAYVLITWWAMVLGENFQELKNLKTFMETVSSLPEIQKVSQSYK